MNSNDRLGMLRALLAEPESIISEQCELANRNGDLDDVGDLDGFLRGNAVQFYAPLAPFAGTFPGFLVDLWWERAVLPLLDEIKEVE